MYDIIIIGGGVAGLGTALTLGSCDGSKIGAIKTLILDEGNSDLLKSELYNVPFIAKGTSGKETLERFKQDALEFKSVSFIQTKVTSIDGKSGEFSVKSEDGAFDAKEVVLATGCHTLDIALNGESISTQEHTNVPKSGMIKVQSNDKNEITDGLYVAGLLSGVTTMFATAFGSGVKVANAIISKKVGKTAVVHDFKGSRG